ncbi:hypothetical protein GCM10010303_14510 [Streptomyces purpurascens]|nr:hypothetical protein GCM10010303_14510 [Streptomyces purpurascens]
MSNVVRAARCQARTLAALSGRLRPPGTGMALGPAAHLPEHPASPEMGGHPLRAAAGPARRAEGKASDTRPEEP